MTTVQVTYPNGETSEARFDGNVDDLLPLYDAVGFDPDDRAWTGCEAMDVDDFVSETSTEEWEVGHDWSAGEWGY